MNSQQIKNFLAAQFSSDQAMGVLFAIEDSDERISLAQYKEMLSVLGEDGMPGCHTIFPDESSAVVCTNHAIQVGKAYPDRTVIYGFTNQDNPTSRIAREEFHPEGHDFAVIDGRYLVDPWIKLIASKSEQIVFDMEDPVDRLLVEDIYGPRASWRWMSEITPAYHPDPNDLTSAPIPY